MFRDAKEELDRLEAELLDVETPEEEAEELQEEEEALLDEEELDALLSDDQKFGSGEGADIYKNYSNGYRAYNSDKTETSPEELSQELMKAPRDPVVTWLTALALLLAAGILGVMVWVLINFRGAL